MVWLKLQWIAGTLRNVTIELRRVCNSVANMTIELRRICNSWAIYHKHLLKYEKIQGFVMKILKSMKRELASK